MGRIKKALIFIVSLHVVSIVMTSCCTDYEDFYWNDFSIRVIDNSSAGHGQSLILLDVNKPIEKARLGFRIFPRLTYSSRQQASRAGIISEAQALSCGIWTERLHFITSIVIKAINVDSEGSSDVTSLFTGMKMDRSDRNEVSVDELIAQINRPPDGNLQTYRFHLLLRGDSIDLTGKQTFQITITFGDGVVLTQETDELTLI